MKIDFSQELKSYNGKPIIMDAETHEAVTLGFVAMEALMHPPQSDDPRTPARLSAADAIARNELARNIFNAEGPLDLKAEDVALIKKLIPQRFVAPVIAAPALEMMEG